MDYGEESANFGYRRDQENEAALQESSALQVLTGAAMISSLQGYQLAGQSARNQDKG